jgi:hypothetical protein
MEEEEKTIYSDLITDDNCNNEKDYARLIAAQNESERRLKILEVEHDLDDASKKRRGYSIAAGICFVGMMVAEQFSGVNPAEAIKTEIEALNSFDSLKEYMGYFTPAMWGTMIGAAFSLSRYMSARKKYKKSQQKLEDMLSNQPTNYLDAVEHQARNK